VSKKEQLVCGLDVGTTKVCLVVGRTSGSGVLEILGSGYSESGGLKKGIVVDLEEAAASIRRAADEAESRSGLSVDWVTAGLSGDHVQSFNCHGAISIEGRNRTVTVEDVSQAINAAQSIPVPPERQVLHVLPQEFFLDGRGGVQNPAGLTCSRLDVDVHVVTCESSLMQNQINAVNRAQMRVRKFVLQQLASAEAVLMPDERELGVAVIDIGGGMTDIALYFGNAIRFTSAIPVGGLHFTRDLAVGLRTPVADAERIKKEAGTVIEERLAEDETVTAPAVATGNVKEIGRKVVSRILKERAVELMELVRDQLNRAGNRDQLVAGAVLTGGGSLLDGMLEVAERVLEVPIRAGMPQGLAGLPAELSHPVYATAVGLALLAARESGDSPGRPGDGGPSPRFVNRFLSWVGS
jgi:cell division protein FtsA